MIAVAHRHRFKRGKIGTGARFRIALAPPDVARKYALQVAALLFGVAEGIDHWANHSQPKRSSPVTHTQAPDPLRFRSLQGSQPCRTLFQQAETFPQDRDPIRQAIPALPQLRRPCSSNLMDALNVDSA